MKVCVLGAGIFGSTIAIRVANAGHEVELFEAKDGLLRGASGINQFRLHRGYHYPRSPETARESRDGSDTFEAEYSAAIRSSQSCKYAIARRGSRVSPAEYLSFCESMMLPYHIVTTGNILNQDEIELVIDAYEARYDPAILRGLVWDRLRQSRVKLQLKHKAIPLKAHYDKIVIAAYVGTNEILGHLGFTSWDTYQYEVCEKPVVRMPDAFGRQTSAVVMDGEFCSVDPFGNSGLHVLGHVKHAIHHTNVGIYPEVPDDLRRYIDRGVVRDPDGSAFSDIIYDGSRFIPMLAQAEYVGSMFTVRVVLADQGETDARPTMVEEIDDQVIRVFSGKVPTCVEAADKVLALLRGKRQDRMEINATDINSDS
jgi:glycine/D-amino acid oxidase-like deaminating enzyme